MMQAEFEVLYPMMERRLGDSCKEARQHSMEEHSKIEEDLIKALEMRKVGGPCLLQRLAWLVEQKIAKALQVRQPGKWDAAASQ